MTNLVAGIFENKENANQAVDQLKQKGYTQDISLLIKEDIGAQIKTSQEKEDVSEGAASGAVAGGVMGALIALLGTAATVAVPGIGTILLVGPLLTLLGATGGAIAGSLVGALVDLGIPEEKAKMFENYILAGEILISITVPEQRRAETEGILQQHGAKEIIFLKLNK